VGDVWRGAWRIALAGVLGLAAAACATGVTPAPVSVGLGALRSADAGTVTHPDTRTCGHVDLQTPGHVDSRTRGHLDTWTPGHLDSPTVDGALILARIARSHCRTMGIPHKSLSRTPPVPGMPGTRTTLDLTW